MALPSLIVAGFVLAYLYTYCAFLSNTSLPKDNELIFDLHYFMDERANGQYQLTC
jgi:hypothetical protein